MKIVFKKPITHGEVTKTEITLREPTVGEVIEAMKVYKSADLDHATNFEFFKALIASVGTVHLEVVGQMRGKDVMKATEYLSSFPLYGQVSTVEDEVVENDDEEILIPLDEPLPTNKGSVTEIIVREPVLQQIIDAKKLMRKDATIFDVMKMNVKLLSAVSGQPENVILRLPIIKYREVEAALNRFQ